jgi:hypothetical protein
MEIVYGLRQAFEIREMFSFIASKRQIRHNVVTDLFKALLGNASVTKFQLAKMETVFQWTNVIARC